MARQFEHRIRCSWEYFVTDQTAAQFSDDLYVILDQATNDELMPIVDLLVASPFSYLKHARAYQRHKPDHSAYRDQIADDIYRLSFLLTEGFSNPAGSMDREKHCYADLLGTVCKQIGIPVVGLDFTRREALLINVFTKQHLLTAQHDARANLVREAANAAGKAAVGRMSTAAWLPFVSALIRIGYLRGIMTSDGRLSGTLAGCGALVPTHRPQPEHAMTIVDEDGQPAFSLANIPAEQAKDWEFMLPDGRTGSQLAPLREVLKPILDGQRTLSGKHIYTSTLPLSYSEKVGGFAGVAKTHQGMMPLQKISTIGLMGPAILVNAVSAIAQQQQMQRIEESLDEIKTMLADVSRFQQDERHSAMTGSIRYFRQIARAVLSGDLAAEVLFTIEHHEAELVRIYEHLVKDLRVAIAALRAIKKDTFGSGKYIKALQEAQATVTRRYDEIWLCMRARAYGFQLMSAYPGREIGKQARYDAIAGDARPFLPDGELTEAIDRALREKVEAISSFDSKAALLDQENTWLDCILLHDRAIMETFTPALTLTSQTSDALTIDFQVEAGEIVGVRLS